MNSSKTTILASSSASDVVTLSLDVDTIEVLNAAAELSSESASAVMFAHDDMDVA